MKTALSILGWIAVVGTLAPLLHTDKWWIRIFDFPRPQLLALGILAVVGLLATHNFRSMGVPARTLALSLLAACGYQMYRILPYLPVFSPQVLATSDASLRSPVSLLVANVLMTNRKAAEFLELVKREEPDVVLVVETDDWWEKQLRSLETEYRHHLKCPLDNTYGILFYTRLELVDSEIRFLLEDDIPSVYARIRLPRGELVDFYGLHPEPPSTFQDTDERDAELLLVGREAKNASHPVIVAGDLNDVAWSHTTRLFQRTSGLLDPRIGRGMYNTYHADLPFLRLPIDHVFHSADFHLVEMKRLGHFGSDHFPIFIQLDLEPRKVERQPTPQPDQEDLEEAEEMIEKER
ncbi:MAG: endonuclease [Acidobacteria bacterium]|nr:MAG: endonuclease [Acidobacteriota bacterium]